MQQVDARVARHTSAVAIFRTGVASDTMSAMKQILAITMGDPTGVGPEIIARAWGHASLHAQTRAVVIGHPEIMRRAIRLVRSTARVVEVAGVAEAESSAEWIPCLRCGGEEILDLPVAQVSAGGGRAAYEAVTIACQLAQAQQVDGLVTAPLNKAALAAAGYAYPGHTELLADLCGVDDVAMMLYLARSDQVRGPAGLGVAHATLHVALRDVFTLLTPPRIVETAHLAHVVTRALLDTTASPGLPRVGVCALNPHAGEQGLFGDEESRVIHPAVERGITMGMDLQGPFPADTLMSRAAAGEFDAVVAMYHDQGHIALKLLGMHQAVNITLGLPVIRTSVAHGTAYDLAWQGHARCESMVEAIRVAAKLVDCRDHLQWHPEAD
ncbi:MAG: 4-hydroxythreonine-4-phosphate dehydrogenase PdxA [Pirellulaceae bacterium]